MKRIYTAALLLAALAAATGAATAARSSKPKPEIIVQEDGSGNWQMFVFGQTCTGRLEAVKPKESGDPLKLVCNK